MTRGKSLSVGTAILSLLVWFTVFDSTEALSGDAIDKTNWERAEGLVPEPVLNWLKKGDLVLDLGELNYDPALYFPQFALDSLQSNIGKYEIDEKGWIVDAKTQEPAQHIVGFPFPKVETNDPKIAEKIMHNKVFGWYVYGHLHLIMQVKWINPSSGLEREIDIQGYQAIMQGWPGIEDLPNRNRIEKYIIISVKAPVDVKGTAIMTWRYQAPDKQDSTFGYLPAIRRVRQMSPANRSDAFVGSDVCIDDSNGYDGKVQAFEWKFVRKQEAIVPLIDKNVQPIEQNKKGEWSTTKQQKYIVYGHEKAEWQGAAWAPTNYVWVRRPVYVIEMRSKDPYYNYGKQYIWIDAETYSSYYKVIYDRAGDYWKSMIGASSGYESSGGEMRYTQFSHAVMVDDRTQHATGTEIASPKNKVFCFADVDPRDFTLAGFQKFCR